MVVEVQSNTNSFKALKPFLIFNTTGNCMLLGFYVTQLE